MKFKDSKQNILHRIADNLDIELDKYIIDILTGFKNISGLDSKLLRRKIYEENKEEIINDMINILQEEVDSLRAENIRPYQKSRFELSESQEIKITTWEKNHECKHRNSSQGAIGGRYTYEFVPTSIGVFCSVKCSCGESLNISEV